MPSLPIGEAILWVEKFNSGELYDELYSEKVRSNENISYAQQQINVATSLGDSEYLKLANKAYNAAVKAKQLLNEVLVQYEKIANDISTYSFGAYTPKTGLSALGAVPIVAVAVVAAAVAASLWAFANIYGNYKSAANLSVQEIDSMQAFVERRLAAGDTPEQAIKLMQEVKKSGTIAPSGGLTESIGILVIVGVVGFIGYMILKKRGTI